MQSMFLPKLIAVPLCAVLLLTGCHVHSVTGSSSVSRGPNGTTVTVGVQVVIDPPGSDLASIDTTQALLGMSLSNATISSTTGAFQLSIKDLTTGTIVGEQSFSYLVRGNSFYAQDPTAVYNWLQQFTSYADVDILINLAPTLDTTTEGSASATSNALYEGTTYASTTVSWERTPPDSDPPPCDTCRDPR